MKKHIPEIISAILLLVMVFTMLQLSHLNKEVKVLNQKAEFLFVKTGNIDVEIVKVEKEQQRQSDADLVGLAVKKIRVMNAEVQAAYDLEVARVEKVEEAEYIVTAGSSRGGSRGDYLGSYSITGYCVENYPHTCNNGDSTYTASGTRSTPGRTVACNFLDFGTKVMINGREYVVEDRGGGVQGFDIMVPTHAEALAMGSQTMEVYLVD